MPISPHGKRRGFSLFELLAVLFILGIAAAVVLPSFSGGLGGIRLETSARDLVTHMRQARSEAVSTQSVHRIIVLPRERPDQPFEYTLADEYETPLRTFSLPQGVVVANEGESESPPMISFYPNGRSSGGSITLASEKGRKLRIEADPITGFGKVVENETSP